MLYRQTFRVPANKLPKGTKQLTESRTFNAASEQQAFRVAQGIAKTNGWAVSGQPVRV